MNFRYSLYVFFLIASLPLFAMNGKRKATDVAGPATPQRAKKARIPLGSPSALKSPSKWTAKMLFNSTDNILTQIGSTMDLISKSGFIAVEDEYLRNGYIHEKLIAAQNRGAEVSCIVGKSAKPQDIEKLKRAGIKVKKIKNLHTKRYLMCTDLKVQANKHAGQCWVWVGSHNNSYVAPHHHENMTCYHEVSQFQKAYWDHYQMCNDVVPHNSPKALMQTPTKRTFTTTRRTKSIDSKVSRITTLLNSNDPTDCIDIASMTFNAKDIVDAIERVKKERSGLPIRLILDRAALYHKPLLRRLQNNGAHIFIFNHNGAKKALSFPKIQHMKIINRRCNGEYLSIVSTGNLTHQSDTQINHDSWHPDDPKMFAKIKQEIDRLIPECIPFEDLESSWSE